MKSIVIIVVVCCAIRISEALTLDQRIELVQKMANECATKEGATAADVEEMIAKKPASTKGGKCIRACLAETAGLLKDNHVNIEGTAAMASMAFEGNPSKIQVAMDLANACADITDPDRCEAAAKIFDCGHNAAKSRGLTFEEL